MTLAGSRAKCQAGGGPLERRVRPHGGERRTVVLHFPHLQLMIEYLCRWSATCVLTSIAPLHFGHDAVAECPAL